MYNGLWLCYDLTPPSGHCVYNSLTADVDTFPFVDAVGELTRRAFTTRFKTSETISASGCVGRAR